MNSSILLFVLLLCGSVSAQDDDTLPKTGENTEAESCYPNFCNLLKQFDAMAEKLTAMETRLQVSEKKLRDSENQILELRERERTKVMFTATVGSGGTYGPFDSGVTVVYKTVITNVGNAYNEFTGIFTAPVTGVYYFTIFYHSGGAYEGMLLLNKNNELMVMTHDHKSDSDSADNGGNAVFVELQQGDQVSVRMPANCHVWGSNHHTSFSGFLVSQM